MVIDSLHGDAPAPARALIAVEGTAEAVAAGADGSFTITGLIPGEYRLRLLHPALDTIGLRVTSPAFTVAAGDTTVVTLALPDEQTIVRAKCGAGVSEQLPAAVFGVVLDVSGNPVSGAAVRLTWTELVIGRSSGLQRHPQEVAIDSSEDGRFRLCGLPPEITGELLAHRGADSSGLVPIRFGTSRLQAHVIVLTSGRVATVRGTVLGSDSTPVSGARVAVRGGNGSAETDTGGRFVLEGQPAGSQMLLVRRIGYQPAEVPVSLDPHLPGEVSVTMAGFVVVLDEVVVRRSLDAALDRVGYAARKRLGAGGFMSADAIERSGATDMFELLRRFRQLRVVVTTYGDRVVVGRPIGVDVEGCVQYFVDGLAWPLDVSPLNYIQPREVGAVEVYSAAFTPSEFTRTFQICETVVIWTRFGLRVR